MEEYIKILDELFLESEEENKLVFIGSDIFDFTTYQDSMDEYFAKRMLEVVEAILIGATFEYIQDEARYINYLTMVNMPFLKDKLEWGSSIRGAWFDEYGHSDDTDRTYTLGYSTKYPKKDVRKVMGAILDWSKA